MSNSVSISTTKITTGAISLPRHAFADLRNFCTIQRMPKVEPGNTVQVPVIAEGQAVIENPTSYEASGDVIEMASATQVHLSAQWGLDRSELNRGLLTTMQQDSHIIKMSAAVLAKVYALLTATNFPDPLVVSAAGFNESGFQTLLNSVPSRTAIVLDTPYWSKTRADWFPPGASGVLQECSLWTGAETNVVGFTALPTAISLNVGHPLLPTLPEVHVEMIDLLCGIQAQLCSWFQRHGRAYRHSLDVVIAPEIGQASSLRLLKSA